MEDAADDIDDGAPTVNQVPPTPHQTKQAMDVVINFFETSKFAVDKDITQINEIQKRLIEMSMAVS